MEVSSNQVSLLSEQRLSGGMSRSGEKCNAGILNEGDCCDRSRMIKTGSGQQMLYGKDGSMKRRHSAARSEQQQRGRRMRLSNSTIFVSFSKGAKQYNKAT